MSEPTTDEIDEQNPTTDGGETRFSDTVSLSAVAEKKADGERVRIARDTIDGRLDSTASSRGTSDVEGVQAILYAADFNSHLENVVLYDADAELFAVASGHERSEAWNAAEHDLKVASVGERLSAVVTAGEFESDRHAQEWADWVANDLAQFDSDDGIHAVKPDSSGFEIVLTDSNIEGLVGDRFTVQMAAIDEEE